MLRLEHLTSAAAAAHRVYTRDPLRTINHVLL